MTLRRGLLAFALVLGIVVALTSIPAFANAQAASCEQTRSTVHLTPTDPAKYHVAGWLCGPRSGRSVEFLIHGFSYNHLYWDSLGDNVTFRSLSYIQEANRQHRTTFAIDQLGAGQSDRPVDPSQLTFTNLAYVTHQLVVQLRRGDVGRLGTRFRQVIGVGHSMGARTWTVEAGLYKDVDGVVIADAMHKTDTAFVNMLRTHYVQANQELPWIELPDGYLTVRPRSLFYDTSLADPDIITRDELYGADTGALGQVLTLADSADPKYSNAITVPVLVVTGRTDAIGCNPAIGLSCADARSVWDREAPYYTQSPDLTAFVFDSGHDTNLHPQAPQWFAFVNSWVWRLRFSQHKK